MSPRVDLDGVEKRKFLTLPGLELQLLSRQSLYRLQYSCSSDNTATSSRLAIISGNVEALSVHTGSGTTKPPLQWCSFPEDKHILMTWRLNKFTDYIFLLTLPRNPTASVF
jgi:hypothetical protein